MSSANWCSLKWSCRRKQPTALWAQLIAADQGLCCVLLRLIMCFPQFESSMFHEQIGLVTGQGRLVKLDQQECWYHGVEIHLKMIACLLELSWCETLRRSATFNMSSQPFGLYMWTISGLTVSLCWLESVQGQFSQTCFNCRSQCNRAF